METIGPACTNQNISGYDEDFVVYYFQDPIPADWDIVPFLLKDPSPVNEETREAALANRFSYADDVAWLAWDSAVVYDPTGSMDIPDLLESLKTKPISKILTCCRTSGTNCWRPWPMSAVLPAISPMRCW